MISGDRAMIFGAVEDAGVEYIKELYGRLGSPLVICADGGEEIARRCGIAFHIAAGDDDSKGAAAGVFPQGAKRYSYPAAKDDTDLQICAGLAVRRGCREVYIVAAAGRRADHYLANIFVLEYLHEKGVKGFLIDPWNEISFYPGRPVTFSPGKRYRYFSILPLDEKLSGVDIRGAKYPLEGAEVFRKSPITVSNEPLGDGVYIGIEQGRALIIWSHD